jgi:hypothetical protein
MILQLIKQNKYNELFDYVVNLKKYRIKDAKEIKNTYGIYFLWRNDVITYIGISQKIYDRIYNSMSRHIDIKTFNYVSYVEIDLDNKKLQEFEYKLISFFKPKDNCTNRGFELYNNLPSNYKKIREKQSEIENKLRLDFLSDVYKLIDNTY